MNRLLAASIALVAMTGTTGGAAEGQLSGVVFGDAYWFAANHDSAAKDANGLWVRRVYLTYDVKQTENVSMRLRFESGSPGLNSEAGKIQPFAKDAYLKWTPSGSKHAIYLGLSGSPTFNSVESAWGYRAVEKTPVDLYRLGSTRDLGLALRGDLTNRLDYHLMVGNGGGTSSESNKGKKYMVSVGLDLTDDLQVRANFDYNDDSASASQTTAQGFLYSVTDHYRWGLQYTFHNRDSGNSDDSVNIVSGYGAYRLNADTAILARVDIAIDENPRAADISYQPLNKSSRFFFILVGLDYSPEAGFSLIPNIEVVSYADSGIDADVVPRLTFSYKF